MKQHIKNKHGSDNRCSVCDEGFPTSKKLYMHIKKAHNKGKIICEKCGKGFFRNTKLKEHIRTHCNYQSALSATDSSKEKSTKAKKDPIDDKKRRVPREQVGDKTPERISPNNKNGNWKCKKCDKMFGSRTGLWKHEKSHAKYESSDLTLPQVSLEVVDTVAASTTYDVIKVVALVPNK